MSTISSDFIRAKTAGVQVPALNVVKGNAKASALLNLATGVASSSYGVASYNDSGPGTFIANLTISMSSGLFSVVSSAFPDISYNDNTFSFPNGILQAGLRYTNGSTYVDCTLYSFSVHGDLA